MILSYRARFVGLLLLSACSGAVKPGATDSPVDLDGDGWTPLDGDCDDDDVDTNPDAIDYPDDGLDQDCSGADAEVLPARALAPGELVLTELQKDPVGIVSAAGEWLELRNNAGVPVDLLGLGIRNDEGDAVRVDASIVVEPGGYAVLGTTADLVLNGEVELDYAYGTELRINNATGSIEILGFADTVLTGLFWNSGFPDEDGRTMQLSPAAADPNVAESWCIGLEVYGIGGWGTPGAPNYVCPSAQGAARLMTVAPGELVITEIMKDPAEVDGDFGEWVEIQNTSASAVDLLGLELVDEDGDGIQVSSPYRLEAGGFALFAASDDPLLNGGLPPVVQAWGTAFSLRNSEDQVTLRFGTREYDTVVYDNGDTFPDPEGIAFGISPGTDAAGNDVGAAWCEATQPYGDGDLGTPGAANPVCP